MVKKRGKWYHVDFVVDGKRYRSSLKTTDRREAKNSEKDLVEKAKQGSLAPTSVSLARLQLGEAFDRYLLERQIEISNIQFERDCSKPLRAFFQSRRLNSITAEDVRAYQAHRIGHGKKPKTVNHEVSLLLRLLRRARLASRIRDDVKLLKVVKTKRQMMTPAEKRHLFETASTKPEWQTAYCAALLTANTSMRPIEIRRLKWQDLEPFERTITVWRSKTDAGERVIPLNEEAWSAVAAMKQSADATGIYSSEHYVFHRQWPKVDPNRPMGKGGWRSAWRSLRKAAGMPKLRYYDLRHQCITELLEDGVPATTVMELAGHIDPEMVRHYSHARMAARRAAVERLSTFGPASQTGKLEGSYGTNSGTKLLSEASPDPQVIENTNRGERI